MAYKVYYDKVSTGTTSTSLTFFAHNEADDGELVTNLASDNQLPEDFDIQRIEILVPPTCSVSDAEKLYKSIMKIKIGTDEVLKVPTAMAFSDNSISVYAEPGNTGTSEYVDVRGTLGGIELPEAIRVPRATRFNIEIKLPSAFGTDTDLIIVLHGRTA